ncbi:hypothetical protein [Paraburkholderia tropica]|uniref:hypothetical protein n=1 Tax=Paraburkholderia tropica TaxID=92647 RepID=UPI002AB186F8|nr:hypothetical protein [Paraburkholderia tropica]
MSHEIGPLSDKLSFDGNVTVVALNHRDIVTSVSSMLSSHRIALLHILYPRTDARTHRSLDALVDALRGHGEHEVATLLQNQAHYLFFANPVKAWGVLREIRLGSLAIGVHLYYCGLTGERAEHALEESVRDAPGQSEWRRKAAPPRF